MELLFKNRNYTLVFFGFLVSSIGDVLFNFAIGLYILDLTHSALSLSIYSAIGGVTWIILAPFGGVLSDRWSRVKIIYITDLVRGVTMLGCGAVILLTDNTQMIMSTLYVTTFLIAVNGALFGPASQAIVPMTVKQEELIRANSLISLMFSVKDVFGLLLAGLLYTVLGPVKIIFIDGISYILSGISEMFIQIKEQESKLHKASSHILYELKEGFHYIVVENRKILLLLAIINGVSLSFAPIQSIVMPYMLNEQFKAPDIHLSFIYMAVALGGIIGSLIISKKETNRFNNHVIQYAFIGLLLALLVQGVGLVLVNAQIISYRIYLMVLVISFILSGLSNMFYHIPVYTSVQKIVPSQYYGRVMSLFTMLSSITMPISMTVGGYILDTYGTVILYVIAIVIMSLTLGLVKKSKIAV